MLLDELIAEYGTSERGLEIREIAGGFKFATKPEYHDAVRGFVKSLKPPLKLTLQALETLAVVAYKQVELRTNHARGQAGRCSVLDFGVDHALSSDSDFSTHAVQFGGSQGACQSAHTVYPVTRMRPAQRQVIHLLSIALDWRAACIRS